MASRRDTAKLVTWARGIFESEAYRKRIQRELEVGICDRSVELFLLGHVYGKPPDHLKIEVSDETAALEQLSDAELDALEAELKSSSVEEHVH